MNINEISLLAGLLEARRLIEERIMAIEAGILDNMTPDAIPRKPPQMDYEDDSRPGQPPFSPEFLEKYRYRGIVQSLERNNASTAPSDAPPAVIEAKRPKSAKWHAAMAKRRKAGVKRKRELEQAFRAQGLPRKK